MCSVFLVLIALNVLEADLFYVISFLGFLVLVEITTPIGEPPAWRTRLRWFIVLGFLVFSYIILRQTITVLRAGGFI